MEIPLAARSVGDVWPFVIAMALMLLALRYNRPIARFLAGLTSGRWPPSGLITEDRPEKLQEYREMNSTAVAMMRLLIVITAVGQLAHASMR
jgi:hypothetical protein